MTAFYMFFILDRPPSDNIYYSQFSDSLFYCLFIKIEMLSIFHTSAYFKITILFNYLRFDDDKMQNNIDNQYLEIAYNNPPYVEGENDSEHDQNYLINYNHYLYICSLAYQNTIQMINQQQDLDDNETLDDALPDALAPEDAQTDDVTPVTTNADKHQQVYEQMLAEGYFQDDLQDNEYTDQGLHDYYADDNEDNEDYYLEYYAFQAAAHQRVFDGMLAEGYFQQPEPETETETEQDQELISNHDSNHADNNDSDYDYEIEDHDD